LEAGYKRERGENLKKGRPTLPPGLERGRLKGVRSGE